MHTSYSKQKSNLLDTIYKFLHWIVFTHPKRRKVRVIFILLILLVLFCTVLIFTTKQEKRYLFEFDDVKTAVAHSFRKDAFKNEHISIGIGCAVTTQGLFSKRGYFEIHQTDKVVKANLEESNKKIASFMALPDSMKQIEQIVSQMPILNDLLPSLCRTASQQFVYKVFISYDFDDPVLSSENGLKIFSKMFNAVTESQCVHNVDLSLELVKCKHTGKPARAQNDAMMAAYRAGMDYLYRINDDTVLQTPHWTEAFISVLKNYNPPNVGVVGPSVDSGYFQNLYILTYEFLHRTHMDIFGFHYPEFLSTWYADDWISHVYQPGRAIRLLDVEVVHTQLLGRRYAVNMDVSYSRQLELALIHDKMLVQDFANKTLTILTRLH